MKTPMTSMLGLMLITVGTAKADIITNGAWSGSSPTLMWMVGNPDNDAYWTYEYWWENTDPGLSHIIIEVSPGAELSEFRDFEASNDGMNFTAMDLDFVELKLHSASPVGGQPNPGMPEDLFGIKFEDPAFFGNTIVHIRFDSIRTPVPGDFFAKGGKSGAYNDGFTAGDTDPADGVPFVGTLPDDNQDPQHIVRPNSLGTNGTIVPEATSIAVWCVVGLTYAGACCWRRQR